MDASSNPSEAPSDLREETVTSQIIETVLSNDEISNREPRDDDSSFEKTFGPLKRALTAAKLSAEDAEALIERCLAGVKAMDLDDGASRRISTTDW